MALAFGSLLLVWDTWTVLLYPGVGLLGPAPVVAKGGETIGSLSLALFLYLSNKEDII